MVDIIRTRGKIHLNTVKERSYWWYILHFWVQFVIWWCTLSICWDYSPNKMMTLGRKAAENSKTNSLTERSFSPLSVRLQDFFLGFLASTVYPPQMSYSLPVLVNDMGFVQSLKGSTQGKTVPRIRKTEEASTDQNVKRWLRNPLNQTLIFSVLYKLKGTLSHFGKYDNLLSCRELEENIDTTLVWRLNMKLKSAAS